MKQRDEHLERLDHISMCRCIASSAASLGLEVVSD